MLGSATKKQTNHREDPGLVGELPLEYLIQQMRRTSNSTPTGRYRARSIQRFFTQSPQARWGRQRARAVELGLLTRTFWTCTKDHLGVPTMLFHGASLHIPTTSKISGSKRLHGHTKEPIPNGLNNGDKTMANRGGYSHSAS